MVKPSRHRHRSAFGTLAQLRALAKHKSSRPEASVMSDSVGMRFHTARPAKSKLRDWFARVTASFGNSFRGFFVKTRFPCGQNDSQTPELDRHLLHRVIPFFGCWNL